MQERLTQLRSILLSLTLGLGSLLLVMIMANTPSGVQAAPSATGISSITAAYDNATGIGDDYSVTRYVDSGLGAATSPYNAIEPKAYNMLHQVDGGNLRLQSFNIGATNYESSDFPDIIRLRRVNNAQVSGAHQLVWVERGTGDPDSVNGGNRSIKPTAITGTMESLAFGDIINRGIDNLFANSVSAGTSANNIERVDVIFSSGLTPIAENLTTHGFLIMDRGGNDFFKVAAITGLDGSNDPTGYGALHGVISTTWGSSLLPLMRVAVLRQETGALNNTALFPVKHFSGQTVAGVFVTFQDLGISAGQTFYGFSLFANDVTGISPQNLLNPATFPTNTGETPGGLDWLGGSTQDRKSVV